MSGEQRTIAGGTKTMSYTYNLDGSVATATYPSGATITYTPDAAGRMLKAVDSANPSAGTSGQAINYVTGATYGPDNREDISKFTAVTPRLAAEYRNL